MNIFNKQYKVIEKIDSNSTSTFYPERTILGVWCRYGDSRFNFRDVSFDTIDKANDFLKYKNVVAIKEHSVNWSVVSLDGK